MALNHNVKLSNKIEERMNDLENIEKAKNTYIMEQGLMKQKEIDEK